MSKSEKSNKARAVQEQRELLQKQLDWISSKMAPIKENLHTLQDNCPHENVAKEAHSNVGNYDPSADRYWYDITCDDCGKRWTEDQDAYNKKEFERRRRRDQ
jgi:hypothetical protein